MPRTIDSKYRPSKCDRALALHESGLSTTQIAERLGIRSRAIYSMLRDAKLKREREIERAGRLADAMGPNV